MERRDFLKISAITTGAVLTINPLSALAETMVSEEIEHRPWKLEWPSQGLKEDMFQIRKSREKLKAADQWT